MELSVQPSDCVRAREDASVRLDGELTELEAARLRAHLDGCAECSEFAAGIERLVAALRDASLEQTAIGSWQRKPQPHTIRLAAVAAVLAVLVTAAGLTASHVQVRRRAHPPAPSALRQLDADRVPPLLRGLEQRDGGEFVAS
jgi:hypothetical protein